MPIWDDEQDLPASQPQTIAQRVRAGAALPILSNAALFDLALFGFKSFRGYYAEKIGYPFPQIPGPAQLANFDRYTYRASDTACKEYYLACLKNHIYREVRAAGVDADTLAEARAQADAVGVTAFAHLLGYPRFDQSQTHPQTAGNRSGGPPIRSSAGQPLRLDMSRSIRQSSELLRHAQFISLFPAQGGNL